jgi:GNAT superfamily N-acetyltransferase
MKNKISVHIARSFEEVIKAVAIRAIVYIGEGGWAFNEDWDGNDFCGTQMYACVDGEPAGSLRIRYFGDFAKLERLAVLPRYRTRRFGSRGVAFELCDAAVNLCLKKGFTRFYGHAYADKVSFWSKIGRGGIKPVPGAEVDYGGRKLIPMFGELPPDPDAITATSGHYVIVRTEGKWSEPGGWELSGENAAEVPNLSAAAE